MRNTLLCLSFLLLSDAALPAGLNDHFDGNALDTTEWTTQEILSRQMKFITPGRCGGSAIDVVVREGDNGDECEDDCQRAELRTAKSTWPRFGDEVWYRFSFRISGDVPSTGSARSVIGQWKGPGDGSPMIAQRFDNGVFYITVQDNEVRRVVAKAEGDPDALVAAQDGLGRLDRTDEKTIDGIRSLQSLDLLSRTQPRVAQEYFKPDLLVTLASRAPASQSEKLSTSLGLADRDIVSRFYALCFIAEPDKYLGKASIAIEPIENRPLPDPRKGWVDMVYRIKPGRTDNEYGPRNPGEIDIWANGLKIVSVRGNIGTTLRRSAPLPLEGPYFKFGAYRLRVPGTFHFAFDEFSQSSTSAGLAPLCASEEPRN